MKESAQVIEAREKARRNREIAKLHLAKKQLGLDDASYRALLKRIAGCSSSSELTADGRGLLLDEMRRLGFQPAPPKAAGRRIPETTGPGGPQAKMIRGIWLDLKDLGALRDPSEQALGHYCKRITGVEAIEWLTATGAAKMIGSLLQWKARVEEQKQAAE